MPPAPVLPSHGSLRPLGLDAVRLHPGFWGDRQELNAKAILPHCQTWVERSGAVDNLRLVRTGALPGARRGREFSDSDVYKLLEAMAWESGRRHGDPELDAAIDSLAAVLAEAQDADGYLGSMFGHPGQRPRYSDMEWGHELYCHGHLIQAAVARLRCHGDDLLTHVARRAADHLCRRFAQAGVCGHPEIETALVELYRATGEQRYLDQAAAFVERRGHRTLTDIEWGRAYFQDDAPVRQRPAFSGHAVRELYFAAGAVDVAVETCDQGLLDAIAGQWERSVATRMYLTGGTGSRHTGEAFGEDFELPPDRAYAETCAAIAMVMLCWRLTLATGEARFADVAERTLFNTVAASPGLAGDAFFYSNPLHVRRPGTPSPPSHLDLRSSGGLRSTWFDVSCCPPNLSRLLGSLAAYQATESDAGVQLHQLTAGEVRAGGLSLTVDTAYPWTGDVTVRVDEAVDRPQDLTIRVPAWASGALVGIRVEGRDDSSPMHSSESCGVSTMTVPTSAVGPEPTVVPTGYVSVTRVWRPGDQLVVRLPVGARWTWPSPRIDAVRGCVALERGPLVYCAESVDLDQPIETMSVDPDVPVEEVDLPALGDGVVAVVAGGIRSAADEVPAWPYAAKPSDGEGLTTPVTLIPYHTWANRGPATMRVFLPAARP
jgi:uncharacterized protein